MNNKLLRDQLLKEMKDSVGTKDPLVFFANMVSIFGFLFEEIDTLQLQNVGLQVKTALAIKWEPKLALDLLDAQINILREDRDVYHNEISLFKKARMEDSVTQNYESFCKFWQDTLGYHPFLNYKL